MCTYNKGDVEYRGHAKEGLEPDSAWNEMGEKTPGTWSK